MDDEKVMKEKDKFNSCLKQDAVANYRINHKSSVFGDEIWKFIVSLRKLEIYQNRSGLISAVMKMIWKYRYHKYSVKCGFWIPINVIGPGLGLPHRGTIVINSTAKIGKNCRIHQGVTIGSTSGSTASATIGNNVFIGANVSIIGDVHIADNVAIGANSLVVKDITEPGTTWGGVPAHKISDKNSFAQLPPKLVKTIPGSSIDGT